MAETQPRRLLSTKAKAGGWNVFLFDVTVPCAVCAGLNLHRHSYVTPWTLYRWFEILTDRAPPQFQLCQIEIDRVLGSVFGYYSSRRGPVLPVDEKSKLLAPGDYGVYRDIATVESSSGGWTHPIDQSGPLLTSLTDQPSPLTRLVWSLEPMSGFLEGRLTKRNAMNEEIKQAVRIRDQTCFVTGKSAQQEDLEVIWIVPPSTVYNLDPSWSGSDYSEYKTDDNAMLLSKSLVEPFYENRFSIDDDYRIVIFQDTEQSNIPSHAIGRQPAVSAPSVTRLKQHLKWTLSVHAAGGDIREDYPERHIRAVMESLGVLGKEEPLAGMDNPLWQNDLGKEILQAQMEDMEGESGSH